MKPLQMQMRQKDKDGDYDMPARARGGRVNLSGKQKKKKLPPLPKMTVPPAPPAAPPAGLPLPPLTPGLGGPPPGSQPGFLMGGIIPGNGQHTPASPGDNDAMTAKGAGVADRKEGDSHKNKSTSGPNGMQATGAGKKGSGYKTGTPRGKGGAPAQPMQKFKKGGTFFIKKAVGDNKGKFSGKAKAAGKTTAEFATEKASAPGTLGKEARLAETLMHLRNRK